MANRRQGMLKQRRKRACEEQIQPHLGKFHHVLRLMKPKTREDIRILLNSTGYSCPAHPWRFTPGTGFSRDAVLWACPKLQLSAGDTQPTDLRNLGSLPKPEDRQVSALYNFDIQPAMARPISCGESSWT